MKKIKIQYDWEFNVLDIENYKKKTCPREAYYNFIRSNHLSMEGDIVESGVYKGRSLLATALLLKDLKSPKKIYGFDSFSGFPSIYNKYDAIETFNLLREEGRISKAHFNSAMLNIKLKGLLENTEPTVKKISSSLDFSNTSKDHLLKKIKLLGLDNIILVEGAFSDTMYTNSCPEKIFACMIDSDLYSSYICTLNFVWPKLVKNGFIYLDEYFSLKFPGARVATDEFLKKKSHKLEMYKTPNNDFFERWFAIKTG